MAHRGAHGPVGAGEENTAAAVRAAADLGYAWVETDVRATADGVAVLAHDGDLVRTAGHGALIAATTLADLLALAPGTTTLAQACAAAPGVHLNIDVKDARAIPAMVALATAEPHLVARWRLASFSERRRRAAVAALAAVPGAGRVRSSASAPLAALCWALAHAPAPRPARGRALSLVARAAGIDCLQLPPTAEVRLPGARRSRTVAVVDAALLDAAHRAGLEVHVWTVDDPDHMARLLDAGVDAVITDDAPAAAAVLAARGAWPPPAPAAVDDADHDSGQGRPR